MITITRYPKDYEISDHCPAVMNCRNCGAEWLADNNSYLTHYSSDTGKAVGFSIRCPFCFEFLSYDTDDKNFRFLNLKK